MLTLLAWAALGLAQGFNDRPPVRWSTFQSGQISKIRQFETRVLVTEGQWQSFWRRLTGNAADTAPRGVNWAREELWVVCLGERRTGGYSVFIKSAQFVDPRNIDVVWVERTPAPGGMVTQALTAPYVVIKVERNAGTPRFVRGEDGGIGGPGTIIVTPGHPGFDDNQPFPLRWGLLDRGAYSWVNQERHFNLVTQREWEAYARNAFPQNDDMLRLGERVRWDDEMVVALHLGVESRHNTVEIDRVTVDREGRVTIVWFERTPPEAQAGRCSPYLIIRIPRYTTAPTIRKTVGGWR